MKLLIALLALCTSLQVFAVKTGTMAPNFTLSGVGSKAAKVSLSDFKGKYVVLEWLNHSCPFVKKHYGSGNMQALQKNFTDKNVIWLSINSSAPGKEGHEDAEGTVKKKVEQKSAATDVLLDTKGDVGKLYGAKTTPHMFIIDKEGKLVYQGAIDDQPGTDPAGIKDSKNYVAQALNELMNGKKVSITDTKSYGCSVKY